MSFHFISSHISEETRYTTSCLPVYFRDLGWVSSRHRKFQPQGSGVSLVKERKMSIIVADLCCACVQRVFPCDSGTNEPL